MNLFFCPSSFLTGPSLTLQWIYHKLLSLLLDVTLLCFPHTFHVIQHVRFNLSFQSRMHILTQSYQETSKEFGGFHKASDIFDGCSFIRDLVVLLGIAPFLMKTCETCERLDHSKALSIHMKPEVSLSGLFSSS